MKLSAQCEICLPSPKATEHIAPEVSLLARSCGTERTEATRTTLVGSVIESLSPWILRPIQIQGNPGDDIRANLRFNSADDGGTAVDVYGQSGSRKNNSIHRPITQDGAREALTLREGNVIA